RTRLRLPERRWARGPPGRPAVWEIPRRSRGGCSTGSAACLQRRTDAATAPATNYRATTASAVRRGSLNPMAQYTKHPVAAPPTAPERESTGHLMLRAYAVLVLCIILAPAALQNALGPVGAGAAGAIATAGTVAIGVPR